MTERTITSGKEAWIGSGQPDRTHLEPSRLKVKKDAALSFFRRPSPVPQGDIVATGTASLWFAQSATGTFTFTLRRVGSAPDWGNLTWNHQPTVAGTWQPTVTVTNPVAGQRIDFDVKQHLSTIANPNTNVKDYGWRVESTSTTEAWFYGDDSPFPPQLYVEWSAKPATPTDLTPAGVIGIDKPVVSASADDVTGEDTVAKVQWQIDPTGDWTGGDLWDSGQLAAEALELDLAATSYPGVAVGATTYQRCRWQNGVTWSDWSDSYTMTRKAKVTVTIGNPGVGGTVLDVTPVILATTSGPISEWRVRIVDPTNPSKVYASSRKKPATGTTIAWEVPEDTLKDGGNYRVQVDVWDSEDRVASPGDPRYVRATRDFTIDETNTVETPTLVSVTEHPTLPANVITVTTGTPPDWFTLYQDGQVHQTKIMVGDVYVSGTTYEILDFDFTWMHTHSYQVRSVLDGKRSLKSAAASIKTTPTGVWVSHPKSGRFFVLSGLGVDDWGRVDTVGEYHVHGADLTVVISAGSSGFQGSFKGSLREIAGRSITTQRSDFDYIQGLGVTEPVLLRAANLTRWVVLLDVSRSPHPETTEATPRDQASFRMRAARKPKAS